MKRVPIISINLIPIVMGIFFSTCYHSNAQDIEIAKILQSAYVMDSCRDDYLFRKAEAKYLLVLEIDSSNIEANYGLGQLYMNKTISYTKILEEKKSRWSDKKLIREVAKAQGILNKGKPYLTRYNRLSSERRN